VTDQFEITLRTGPSTSNAIRLSLRSGAELQIIERDEESGYTRVSTEGGTEGWVLTRYLMNEPSAREQLAQLMEQLSSASAEGSSLSTQLNSIRAEYREAEQQIAQLGREKAALESELDEIRRTAANVLAIDRQNDELQEKLTNAEISIDRLNEEVRTLTGQSNRTWFITGALVLFGGVILGLILPRMRWQRRSRYDTF
jgi:SH3 domain protein